MKGALKSLPVILALVVGIMLAGAADADAPSPATITIEGKEYPRLKALNAFLQAAINKHLAGAAPFPNLLPSNVPGVTSETSVLNPDHCDQQYPWLCPLLLPGAALPNHMAISRWATPIRIALGSPGTSLGTTDLATVSADAVRVAAEEAALLTAEMARLTGLSVAFVAEEPTTPSLVPNMRIVLVAPFTADSWMSPFKKGPVILSGSATATTPAKVFGRLGDRHPSAIHFSPILGPFQVDGFFIANSNNEITFSACYIRDDHDDSLLRRLVRECLVRSVGLPDLQKTFPHSAVGPWNAPRVEKGVVREFYKHTLQTFGPDVGEAVALSSEPLSLFDLDHQYLGLDEPAFSEADEYLIRTLYSEALRPGMSHVEAFTALYHSQEEHTP